jgi:malate permease and related proteins
MTGSLPMYPVYQFIIIALVVVAVVRLLKRKGIFGDLDQPVFDKIVTELAVPAVIFSIFATYNFSPETLFPALILFCILIIALVVAYIVCRIFRFDSKLTGTIVLLSGFGSTATMAGPLFMELYPSHPEITAMGNTIGTLGVAFPFFSLGVIIASWFGAKAAGEDVRITKTLKEFLATPIFISFIAGALVAVLLMHFHVPGADAFVDIFSHFFTIINLSLNLFIWIAIGLMIRPMSWKIFAPLFIIVIIIKLLFSPVLAIFFATSAGVPLLIQQILLLESAVPSGIIAAVLASRYGLDGSLAGWMVVGTFLMSLLTIPLVFFMIPT